MASSDLASLDDHWEKVNRVVDLYLKGETRPNVIAKTLGMKVKEVNVLMDDWRQAAYSDAGITQRAREALQGADKHYSMLIKEAWDLHEEAASSNNLPQRGNALKIIADVQTKQIDMLNKAGVLSNADTLERVVEEEEKREKVEAILKEVVAECDRCRPAVYSRLNDEVVHIG